MRDHTHKSPRPTRSGPSRRALLVAGAAGGAALGMGRAAAQDGRSWIDNLQNFGGGHTASRPTPVKQTVEEVINDLRTDNVPWRSDTMVDYVDKAIARFEQIAQKGGWPMVPVGRTLRVGDDDGRVTAARKRLAVTGEMPSTTASYSGLSSTFDDRLETGLRVFQERHGLRLTGRLDRPSVEAMNVSAAGRLEQLKVNRRRLMDLMQGRIEDRYVLVNAAAYQLEAVDNHEVVQRHRTIVGKPDRQTPSINATIKGLNFFPYWRVPKSVAVLDLIPRLRKEPEYLQKEGIRVYNGVNGPELDPTQIDWNQADGNKLWFRQDPGERNALGLVRIDMPNPDIVYLHDTPLKPLFTQRQRPFSAGCVRVQDVMKLAEWLARQELGWEKPGRAAEVIQANQPLDLTLTRPVPVYFTYITAWAERDGGAVFYPDIYGRDGLKEAGAHHDPEAGPPPSGGLAP